MKILIADDELPMRLALKETLRSQGYGVTLAENGEQALEAACEGEFDLILLDVMMPRLDGYAVCRELRRRERHLPILMLTAKGEVDDRVKGLDCGADDYLVKPFSRKELFARTRALLRRSMREEVVPDVLTVGDRKIDFISRRVESEGGIESLSEKEIGILRLLISRSAEPVSRESFLDVVWGYQEFPSTRTVDNFVHTLRSKLNDEDAQLIVTIRGRGYSWRG